jgi:glycosyltransferase involved in cell wall biosynthesis
MRLLFLCEGPPENADQAGSGSPAFLIQALRAQGAEVVAHDADASGFSKYAVAAISWRLDGRRWRALYRLGGIARRIRDRRATALARAHRDVDAILQYGATFSVVNPSKPLFVYCDDFFTHRRDDPHRPAAVLTEEEKRNAEASEQVVYDAATKIFTMSAYLNEQFTALLGVPGSRLETVYAGTNLQSIPAAASSEPSGVPTVLFVGREFGLKGGETLLRAFRHVRAEIPNARLVIIGPRDLRIEEPGIEVLGFLRKNDPVERERMERAYREATVFCLPTESESFGIAVLEALLYEVPVVTTRAWALPESIIDGVTGYTVPMRDDRQLADRVVELLRDSARARALGRAGRALVLERYHWDAVARSMLTAISDTLSRGGKT